MSASRRASAASSAGRGLLRYVAVVHRHGDRAPGILASCTRAESDAWARVLPDPDALGAVEARFPAEGPPSCAPPKNADVAGRLTRAGSAQLFQLGRFLRETYLSDGLSPLLRTSDPSGGTPPPPLSPRVLSSNYLRTRQSAQFLLAGMGVRDGCPVVVEEAVDCKIDMFSRHHAIHTISSALAESSAFREHEAQHNLGELRDALSTMPCFAQPAAAEEQDKERDSDVDDEAAAPYHRRVPWQWFHASDALTCYAHHVADVPVPPTLAPLMQHCEEAERYLLWRFQQYYAHPEVLDLASRDLLRDLAAEVHRHSTQQKGYGEDEGQDSANAFAMTIYSGHDVTLMPLLLQLKGLDADHSPPAWPTYASHIAFELWEDRAGGGDFSLTLKYFNGLPQASSGHESCTHSILAAGSGTDNAATVATAAACQPTGTLNMAAASFVQRWL